MKRWECTVCGYIHEGDEPPQKCPVCGADKSMFVLLEPEQEAREETDSIKPETQEAEPVPELPVSELQKNPLFGQMVKHHVHPVSVHIPNGVLPVAVIFIVLSAVFNLSGLSQAAFYNLVFVVVSMPLVLFSGYLEWQMKYGGNFTTLFVIKMTSAGIVVVTAIVLVVWLYIDPQVAVSSSSGRMSFLIVNFIMLAAAGTAGFYGGKLVFKD
ncbi:rubredoxin-like domain-containing protein [Thermodesulfobacteriota bacterium]